MNRDDYIKLEKKKILSVAIKLLNDEGHFVENIRIINNGISFIGLEEREINLLVGVDSNTDEVPIGEVRKIWNKEALRKIDDEISDYLDKVKPLVKEICKKIVRKIEGEL